MSWFERFLQALHAIFRREESAQDMYKEFQFHFERLVEEHVAAGMSPEEARRRAMNVDPMTALRYE